MICFISFEDLKPLRLGFYHFFFFAFFIKKYIIANGSPTDHNIAIPIVTMLAIIANASMLISGKFLQI